MRPQCRNYTNESMMERFAYPDNIQVRKFISRLLPELYIAVKPFADQTLQVVIDRARACELTLRKGKKKPSNYATTVQSETTELAKIVSTLVTQVGELTRKVEVQPNRYRPPRNDDFNPRDNTNNRNATSGNISVTCYTCGQPGHISRRCPNKGTNTTNDKTTIDPNTLQTLIQQLATQNQLGATNQSLN